MNRLAQCVEDARECAGLFRLGRDVEAALNMVEVFDIVQLALESASPQVRQQWAQLLARMLACQESQDWLGLADWMAYELVGLLESAAIP